MDIVKDLWPEFIDDKGDQLVSEIKKLYGITIDRAHVKFHYNIKKPDARQGADFGTITYDYNGSGFVAGAFKVDYSEPCIVYELYEPEEDLL